MYRYFISFQYVIDNIHGTGNYETHLAKPIASMSDIKLIKENIEKDMGVKDVVIMFFQLFE